GVAGFSVSFYHVAADDPVPHSFPTRRSSDLTVSFSAQHDPSNADTAAGFHYAYACDNGSLASATYGGSGTTATHPCTFDDNGTYTVKARIIDKDGGFTEYTTDVVVDNVAPTVTAPSDQSSNEGANHSFALGSFSDPGTQDDPWHVTVDWGDGSTADAFDTSA